MTDVLMQWLSTLWFQSVFLSVACLILLALRPLMLRWFGASATYIAWLSIPLGLVAQAMPSLGWREPGLVVNLKAATIEGFQASAAAGESLSNALAGGPVIHSGGSISMFFGVIWLAGFLLSLIWMYSRHREMMTQLAFDPVNGLWRSPMGTGPALVGVLRSKLCLPQDFEQRFSSEEQSLILTHEFEHQRRFDNASNLAACLVCCVHWFNPLVWLALRSLRADQELSCDSAVIRKSDKAAISHYANALLKAQELNPLVVRSPSVVCTWQSSHPLLERVSMLNRHRTMSIWRRRTALMLSVALSISGAGLVHALSSTESAKRIEPPIQNGYHLVEIDADIKVNGAIKRAIRITSNPASWTWIGRGTAVESDLLSPLYIGIQPTASSGNTIRLDVSIAQSDPNIAVSEVDDLDSKFRVVGKFSVILKAGQKKSVFQTLDAHGKTVLSMDLASRWILADSLSVAKHVVDRN